MSEMPNNRRPFSEQTVGTKREAKRVYEPPRLEEVAAVAEITRGPGSGTIDAIGLGQGGFDVPS